MENLDGTISKCEKEVQSDAISIFKVAYPYVTFSSQTLQVQWSKFAPALWTRPALWMFDCTTMASIDADWKLLC